MKGMCVLISYNLQLLYGWCVNCAWKERGQGVDWLVSEFLQLEQVHLLVRLAIGTCLAVPHS